MKFASLQVLLLLCLGLLSGCDKFEYHPYDTHISGSQGLTARNIEQIQSQCAGKDTLRVAQISDTQRWYDETQALVDAINARGDVDFVIHCGDQSDFGLTKEFEWQRDIMAGFKMPWVCIIGNHDCLGTGEDVYHAMYGSDDFAFNASFLHVVCLNTVAFEYDHSANVPDFSFIRSDRDSLLATDSLVLTNTIVAMHAAPGNEQFDNNISDFFNYSLRKYRGLLFCLCGHDHHTTTLYPYGDDLPFYMVASANRKTYILYTITRNSYEREVVQL